jgi:hypothetical protein
VLSGAALTNARSPVAIVSTAANPRVKPAPAVRAATTGAPSRVAITSRRAGGSSEKAGRSAVAS